MDHELKIRPEYFHAVKEGRKNFELRKDDRKFHVGDTITLKELAPFGGYTGATIKKRITYIFRNTYSSFGIDGLKQGYCILAMEDLK